MKKEKLVQILAKIWLYSITLLIVGFGVLILTDFVDNPFTHDQTTGILLLIFAVIYAKMFSEKIQGENNE